MTKLGDYIDRILEDKNINLEEFCRNSDIFKSYFYKIKSDTNLSVTLVVATGIANGLKVHPEELLKKFKMEITEIL